MDLTETTTESGDMGAQDTLCGLAEKLIHGEINSVQLVQDCLTRINDQSNLNTFITVDREGAMRQAHDLDRRRGAGDVASPLHGLPLIIKDNIHVEGLPCTAGTDAMRGFVPKADAPAVKRIRDAGAIILGTGNMHELAFGITSDNHAYGPVGNAWQPDHIAGGSSGGVGSAIAADLAPAGLGTDTGGSVRIPAVLNGIAGFRPTTGRYPGSGVTPLSSTRDTIGPMAHDIRDMAMLDGILSATDTVTEAAPQNTIRLGVSRMFFMEDLHPDVAAMMENVIAALRENGITLVEQDLPRIKELNAKSSFPIVLYETKKMLPEYFAEHGIDLTPEELLAKIASPDVRAILTQIINEPADTAAYQEALQVHRPALCKAYRDYFQAHHLDALLIPATPLPAVVREGHGQMLMLNGREQPTFDTYIRYTDPGSNAGLPCLAFAAGLSADGLPIGLELTGPEGSDRRLLSVGMTVEYILRLHDLSTRQATIQ